jgi:hypothetical protein
MRQNLVAVLPCSRDLPHLSKAVFLIGALFAGASLLPAQPYVISTAAGGVPPSTPAAATGSSVAPGGLSIDAAGNVYFSSHNAVFRVDSKGILTQIAGTSPSTPNSITRTE